MVQIRNLNNRKIKFIRTHPNMSRNCLPYIFSMNEFEEVVCEKVIIVEDSFNKNLQLEPFEIGKSLM